MGVVDQYPSKRTLLVIAALGVTLLFPLMLPAAQKNEDELALTPFAQASGGLVLLVLRVVAVSMLLPSLVQTLFTTDASPDPDSLIHKFYLAVVPMTVLMQLLSPLLPQPVLAGCCLHLCLSWILSSLTLLGIFPSNETIDSHVLYLTLLFIYIALLVSSFGISFLGSWTSMGLPIVNYTAVSVIASAFLYKLIYAITKWYDSRMSFSSWFHSLPPDYHRSLSTLCVAIFCGGFLFAGSLWSGSDQGLQFSTTGYLYSYYSLVNFACLLKVILLQLSVEWRSKVLESNLEGKRQFLRYMSHELRYSHFQ